MNAFDDAALRHDYNFLEGAIRAVDSSKRRLHDVGVPAASKSNNNSLTPGRQNLLSQASKRGIHLELMPHGMQRQRANTTHYEGRKKQICWRVELRFSAAGVVHSLPSVPEGCTILRVLQAVLEPGVTLVSRGVDDKADAASSTAATADSATTRESAGAASGRDMPRRDDGIDAVLRHKLRAYSTAGAANLRVYLLVEGRQAADPKYHRLPLEASLSTALNGKRIFEFPTLHVAMQDAAEEAAFPPLGSHEAGAGCPPSATAVDDEAQPSS